MQFLSYAAAGQNAKIKFPAAAFRFLVIFQYDISPSPPGMQHFHHRIFLRRSPGFCDSRHFIQLLYLYQSFRRAKGRTAFPNITTGNCRPPAQTTHADKRATEPKGLPEGVMIDALHKQSTCRHDRSGRSGGRRRRRGLCDEPHHPRRASAGHPPHRQPHGHRAGPHG